MLDIDTPIQFVKGVGPAKAEALAKAGIRTVYDLLLYLPFRYEDRSRRLKIRDVQPGQEATVEVEVVALHVKSTRRKNFKIVEVVAKDETGQLKAVWFNQEYLKDTLKPGRRVLIFRDGTTAEFDLLAYVPPHRAPGVVTESGLTAGGDWIPVDRGTLQTATPGVYAIGDVVTIPLSLGKPLPKAGIFAHEQAEVVAANLAAEWSGETPRAEFDGHGYCFIETGNGRAGYGTGNFYGEPRPEIRLHRPSRLWHATKVLFEKTWWWRWL